MKFFLGVIVASVIWIIILSLIPMPESGYKIYDCGMAEWHPDIPPEVKEECRKRFRQQRPGYSV